MMEKKSRTRKVLFAFRPVESSWLVSIEYDNGRKAARLSFRDGFSAYYPMTGEVYSGLKAAPSKGKWLWRSGLMHNYYKED
jgi:hypothetical protein